MEKIPYELKLTFLVALLVTLGLVVFIVLLVTIYKKRQSDLLIQKKLADATAQNALLQKDLEKLQALNAERERIAMDMHDELGSNLSRIRLLTEMLYKQVSHPETQYALSEIMDNTKGLTSTMRELVWTLNPVNDNLENLILYIRQFTKQFFEPSSIRFEGRFPEHIPTQAISGLVRRNIILATKEILNNCVKHAEAKTFELFIETDNTHIHLHYKDDGKGIQEENLFGNGLKSIRKRIAAIQGAVTEHSSDKGLEIHVSIPYSA